MALSLTQIQELPLRYIKYYDNKNFEHTVPMRYCPHTKVGVFDIVKAYSGYILVSDLVAHNCKAYGNPADMHASGSYSHWVPDGDFLETPDVKTERLYAIVSRNQQNHKY